VQGPERQGDLHIMEVARRSKQYGPNDLRRLNYCRLYLHVTTVSELLDPHGQVLHHMSKCQRPPWFDPSTITVIQSRPTSKLRLKQWYDFCLRIATLQHPGPWIPHCKLRLRRETYLLPPPQHTIYHWHIGSYWECTLSEASHSLFVLHQPTEWTPDMTAQPIHCSARIRQKLYLHLPPTPPSHCNTRPIPADFTSYLSQLPKWEQVLLAHIRWSVEPFRVMLLLTQMDPEEKLFVVSDGSSFESTSMSFGLAIGTSSGTPILENMGPAYGKPSSHRAECTGCLSGALALRHLQLFTQMPFPATLQTIVISDNAAMIKSLTDRATYQSVYPNATLVPDWDLLEEIHHQYKEIDTLHHTYQWVRGHQDASPSTVGLSSEAQLNVQADSLAAEYSTMIDSRNRPQTPMMSSTRCILQISSASIHAQYPANLRRSAATPILSEYLTAKHTWLPGTFARIDWASFRMAARTYHSSEVHLLKLVHDMLPTRSHLPKFQPWTVPQCHYCEERDTIDHLQRTACNPVSARYTIDLHDAVTQYFDRHNTPQAFQITFLHCLLSWISGSDDIDTTAPEWKGSPALHCDQKAIGWRLLPRGMLSTHWTTLLTQSLHNDHWRTQHIDLPEYTCPKWSIVDNPSSSAWSILESDSDTSLCLFEPEYIVEFDIPDALRSTTSRTIDPTIFIAGLIKKTLWVELATLWRSHLEMIHQTSITKYSPVTREEVIIRVRNLQEYQQTVEIPLRTSKYFPSDINLFIEKSSLQQLQNYIEQYTPVLQASHSRHQTTTPLAPHTTNPTQLANLEPTSDESTSTHASSLHPALEEAQHRKHNKRRNQPVETYELPAS
jgi:hypothetical protein